VTWEYKVERLVIGVQTMKHISLFIYIICRHVLRSRISGNLTLLTRCTKFSIPLELAGPSRKMSSSPPPVSERINFRKISYYFTHLGNELYLLVWQPHQIISREQDHRRIYERS
jgi:hypothetical protein